MPDDRCQRCWGERDLKVFKRSSIDDPVVLCKRCRRDAPRDPFLFKNLFLRFESPRAMIRYYGVTTESEAMERWRSETGYVGDINSGYGDLIKEKMREKAKKGRYLGFGHPMGYNYENGVLKIDKKEGKIVKDIFRRYLSGKSIGGIADELNKKGIPTKHGRRWYKITVSKILRNPLYCGYISWDGLLKRSYHDPLVTVEIFNKVQRRLSSRAKTPPRLIS